MTWTPPSQRVADTIEAPEDFNAEVIDNLIDLNDRLETVETTLADAPTTLDGSSTDADCGLTVTVAGWYRVFARARGQISVDPDFPNDGLAQDVYLTIDGTEVDDHTVWIPEGTTRKYSVSGFLLVECPLGTETITVHTPTIAGVGVTSSYSIYAMAVYDSPSA